MRASLLLALLALLAAPASAPRASAFELSNTLGDHMVLQRDDATSQVWGFADPGDVVTTTLSGHRLVSTTDKDGVWRQRLPEHPASLVPETISFSSSSGASARLDDVLWGDVYLCGGYGALRCAAVRYDNVLSAAVLSAALLRSLCYHLPDGAPLRAGSPTWR